MMHQVSGIVFFYVNSIHYIFLFLGADGRIHSVTKYSPLYIAAYNGRRDIVDILLKRFPNIINVLTVEKWSPLHAAVINGHVSTLDLLLRFSYPKECLKTMRDKKGEHIVRLFLDRHHAWRSLDPTLDIWSNFVKKKEKKESILPPLLRFCSFHLLLH